jgi:hypothetical protein
MNHSWSAFVNPPFFLDSNQHLARDLESGQIVSIKVFLFYLEKVAR